MLCNSVGVVEERRAKEQKDKRTRASFAIRTVNGVYQKVNNSNNDNKMLVIEASYLRGKDGEIVVKELSCISSDKYGNSKIQTYQFYAPYPDTELPEDKKRSNSWAVNNKGVSPWGRGDLKAWKLEPILIAICRFEENIYAKGREKTEFLNKLIGKLFIDRPEKKKIVNLEDLGCPKAESLYLGIGTLTCGVSTHNGTNCTLNNANKFSTWLKRREQQMLDQEMLEQQTKANQQLMEQMEQLLCEPRGEDNLYRRLYMRQVGVLETTKKEEVEVEEEEEEVED